jgi:hypothetical protein
VELSNIKRAAAQANKKNFYPTHHSFLLGNRDFMPRPKVRDLGSENWQGTEEEKDKLRRILWKNRSHR